MVLTILVLWAPTPGWAQPAIGPERRLPPAESLSLALEGNMDAARELANWGAGGLTLLLRQAEADLARPDGRRRARRARQLLVLFGPDAGVRLIRLLDHTDPAVRAWAALALAQIPHPDATTALLNLLDQEPDPAVRRAVLHSLGSLGSREALPHLLDRLAAADRLPLAEELALRTALYGFTARPLFPELLAGLEAPSPEVRRVSVELVGRCGDRSGLSRLLEMVADPEPAVAETARQAILGADRAAIPYLEEGLVGRLPPPARQLCARQLGTLDAASAWRELAEAGTVDPHPEVARAARIALKEIWDRRERSFTLPEPVRWPITDLVVAELAASWQARGGEVPATLSELLQGLDRLDWAGQDAWGRPLELARTEGTDQPILRSLGRNGMPGGEGPDADLVYPLNR